MKYPISTYEVWSQSVGKVGSALRHGIFCPLDVVDKGFTITSVKHAITGGVHTKTFTIFNALNWQVRNAMHDIVLELNRPRCTDLPSNAP